MNWLKENNPYYQDVQGYTNDWVENCLNEDAELWEAMTEKYRSEETNDESIDDTIQSTICDDTRVTTEHLVEPCENESSSDVENKNNSSNSFQDTCLQRTDPNLDIDKIISVAPGEKNFPLNLMLDEGCEEMAFPKLFPTGRFGFQVNRDVKLTCKKYFNARVLNYTGKFSSDTDYLFFAQYICEYKSVMDNMSIAMRKTFQATGDKKLNSGMTQNSEKLKSLLLEDHAYRFLRNVRGSPPYWQNVMYKLIAAVKQFGIFTFFVTLSAADMRWKLQF